MAVNNRVRWIASGALERRLNGTASVLKSTGTKRGRGIGPPSRAGQALRSSNGGAPALCLLGVQGAAPRAREAPPTTNRRIRRWTDRSR